MRLIDRYFKLLLSGTAKPLENESLILNEKEFGFMQDQDFLLTKAIVTEKLIGMLEHAKKNIREIIDTQNYALPSGTDTEKGKISRGEYYKKLPWIILDYPKQFSNECIFTFRTLFRWGNEFSCTLHIQHKPFEEIKSKLISSLHTLKGNEVHICVNQSPWEYHYDESNYLLLDSLTREQLEKIILEKAFIKLNRKIPLKEYKRLSEFSKDTFRMMMDTIFLND